MRMSKKVNHHMQSNGDGGKAKKQKKMENPNVIKHFRKKKGNASREVVKIDQKYIENRNSKVNNNIKTEN